MVDDDEIVEAARKVLQRQPVFRTKDVVSELDQKYSRGHMSDRLNDMYEENDYLEFVQCGNGKAWWLEFK